MSEGRLISQGPVDEILSNTHVLREANLSPPSITQLFIRLKTSGVLVDIPQPYPTTVEDGEKLLRQLLKATSNSYRCAPHEPDLYAERIKLDTEKT
jgi:hypothetical protein